MTSKFERDLLLPAYDFVQKAHALESKIGTSYRLGFSESRGDEMFTSFLVEWAEMGLQPDMTMAPLMHGLLRWYDGGCPRFRLTHGLTTELALTDPTGVPMTEVRQPFPAYVIELPKPNGPMVWSPSHAMVGEPSYLLVHTNMIDEKPEGEAFGKTYKEIFAYLSSLRDRPRRPRLAVEILENLRFPNTYLSRDHFVDSEVVDARSLGAMGKPILKPNDVDHSPLPEDEGCMTMAWRIAFNLPLYLRHRPSSASSSGKTVNHDHGMRSTLYEVGADVPLNRDLRDAARAACKADDDVKKWMIATRFIVRGHWKQQAYGVGRSERKLIFVEPYWKGDASSPLVARAHVDRSAR